MGRLLKLLLLCTLIAILLSPLAAYYMVLTNRPMAMATDHLEQQDLVRVQRLVAQQISQADAQGRVTLKLGERDINTAITFALQTANIPIVDGAVLKLDDQTATLSGSLALPLSIGRHFINYQAILETDAGRPHIAQLHLGYLSVPPALLQWLENQAMDRLYNDERLSNYRQTWETVEQVDINDGQLSIVYRITQAVIEGVASQQKKLLLEQIDSDAVDIYMTHLEPISEKLGSRRSPLSAMLVPAYELAQQRSDQGHDPVAENSAALISLAIYVADPTVLQLMGLDQRVSQPGRRMALTLHRRKDLAKHFLTAALISLFAGDQVADLIGMQKELNDSQSSSGFGLADLVADKGGIRFADLATSNPASARRLQQQVVLVLYDDQLLPSPDALPQLDIENELARLDDSELETYMAGVDRQINQLLAAIPLYQM
jgi:hypothetical protein